MNEQDILTALKICVAVPPDTSCSDCPYNNKSDGLRSCTDIAVGDALDLINRQKAEIERLKADHIADVDKKVKDFAERAKAVCNMDGAYGYISPLEIDALVEEMTKEATT